MHLSKENADIMGPNLHVLALCRASGIKRAPLRNLWLFLNRRFFSHRNKQKKKGQLQQPPSNDSGPHGFTCSKDSKGEGVIWTLWSRKHLSKYGSLQHGSYSWWSLCCSFQDVPLCCLFCVRVRLLCPPDDRSGCRNHLTCLQLQCSSGQESDASIF